MGLNSRTKSLSAQVCALAKSPKKASNVTSGHTTVRQNHGHNAGQEYRNAPTSVASMSKWSSVAMLHAVEKTFLAAQPVQLVALTSPEACY